MAVISRMNTTVERPNQMVKRANSDVLENIGQKYLDLKSLKNTNDDKENHYNDNQNCQEANFICEEYFRGNPHFIDEAFPELKDKNNKCAGCDISLKNCKNKNGDFDRCTWSCSRDLPEIEFDRCTWTCSRDGSEFEFDRCTWAC